MVRHANASRRRTRNVVLPYQNQAGGDALRLWPTTFSAYVKRLVVSAILLVGLANCQCLSRGWVGAYLELSARAV